MTHLTGAQLLDRVERMGAKTAIIYDRIIHKVRTDLPNFERFDCDSTDDLTGLVEKFCAEYNGIFSVLLRKSSGGNDSATTLVVLDTRQQTQTAVAQGMTKGSLAETEEQIEARIIEKLKTKMLLQQIDAERKALEAEKESLRYGGGKLAFILEHLLLKKVGPAPAMQGTDEQEAEEINDNDEGKEEKLTAAFADLGDELGTDTIIKLAEKLKSGDKAVIDMVKNYANS